MEKEEYIKKIFEIRKKLNNDLALLQEELTKEELIEFRPIFDYFLYDLVEGAIGKELVVHYLISILNMASKKQFDENHMQTASEERYKQIKEGNKEK